MGEDWIASTSSVPSLYDNSNIFDVPLVYDPTKKKIDKVGTLKIFLRICLDLMKDKSVLCSLDRMIYHCSQEKEKLIVEDDFCQQYLADKALRGSPSHFAIACAKYYALPLNCSYTLK